MKREKDSVVGQGAAKIKISKTISRNSTLCGAASYTFLVSVQPVDHEPAINTACLHLNGDAGDVHRARYVQCTYLVRGDTHAHSV